MHVEKSVSQNEAVLGVVGGSERLTGIEVEIVRLQLKLERSSSLGLRFLKVGLLEIT